jgi:hypothetical protein
MWGCRWNKGGVEDAEKSAGSGDSAELEEAEERGCSDVKCREWEEWGEEGSRTGCGSCAADCGMRMVREGCCRVLQELDSREDKGGVYGKDDSLKITSLEM